MTVRTIVRFPDPRLRIAADPVTVFDEDPRRCRKVWKSLGFSPDRLRIIEKRLPYRDYLAEMEIGRAHV